MSPVPRDVDSSTARVTLQVAETPCDANLPRISFYYAGTCALLGWNFVLTFTTAFDCGLFGGARWAGSGWPFWASLTYSISLNLVQAAFGSRKVTRLLPFSFRWIFGLIGMAIGVLGLLGCYLYGKGGDRDINTVFAMGLFLIWLLGFSGAAFQSAVYGMAGSISPDLMRAIMVGSGIAGVLAGAVGFSGLTSNFDMEISFSASAAFLLCGVPLYFSSLRRNPHVALKVEEATKAPAGPLLGDSTPGPQSVDSRNIMLGEISPQQGMPRRRSSAQILVTSAWPQALTVCSVFIVTFTVFPGVLSRWTPGSRVTALVATFQVMDVIGRSAPELSCLQIKQGSVVSILAGLRAVFIPIFMWVQRGGEDGLAASVALQYSMMILFAFTNGYVSTLSMMLGPQQHGVLHNEQAAAGGMMSNFLILGILLGSLLALPTQIGISSADGDC